MDAYVDDLPNVVDIHAIRAEGVRIGADPLGGASVDYWGAIAEAHNLDLTVVNPLVDATWRFMTLDTDGKIRMDCSSPNAMASLIGKIGDYQIATGNDADSDRHGIVTPDGGLMNPNHYLAVAIDYLYTHRPGLARRRRPSARPRSAVRSSTGWWPGIGRKLLEVPVGFKWFVDGLISGTIGFGGEEIAGASFLRKRRDRVDHRQGRHHPGAAGLGDPGRHRQDRRRSATPNWPRSTARRPTPASTHPPTASRRRGWPSCRPSRSRATELAGEPITAKLTTAPGNGAALGGLKVTTENAWFAARPSGTEDVYKIYAESFKGPEHLARGAGRRPRGGEYSHRVTPS